MKKQQAESLPVTQRDLAAYLGIAGSLLSMTNTGRHGTRRLGAASSKKMSELLLVHARSREPDPHSPSFQKLQERAATECTRLAKAMLSDANHAEAHLFILKRHLDDMIEKEQQDLHWLQTVDHLLAALPKANGSQGDRIWLKNQQQVVLKRLQKNGLPAQLKLETQIERKKATVKLNREILKKLQKK